MSARRARRVRVAIVSDTHGALDERVLAAVGECDVAVHAGDVGGTPVLEALAQAVATVVAVRGNNDVPAKWSGGKLAALQALPESTELPLPGGSVAITHGHRALPASERHRRLRQLFAHARLVIYGHSHRLCIDRDLTPWVANPGAAGRARTFGGPSMLVLHAAPGHWTLTPRRFAPVRR